MIEDAEGGLVLAGSEQVGAEPGATPDHLPELDVGLHRLGEHQVNHFRHVDARIQHIHRDGQSERVAGFLEVIDELLGAHVVGVDHPTEQAAVLRIQLVENLG